jgi:hypothetical protein
VLESRIIFGRQRVGSQRRLGGGGGYGMCFVCGVGGGYSWDDEEIEVDGHVAHMEG